MRINTLYIVISNVLFLAIVFLVVHSESAEAQPQSFKKTPSSNSPKPQQKRAQQAFATSMPQTTAKAPTATAKSSVTSADTARRATNQLHQKHEARESSPSSATFTAMRQEPTPPTRKTTRTNTSGAIPSYTKLPPCCPTKRTRLERIRDWLDTEIKKMEAELRALSEGRTKAKEAVTEAAATSTAKVTAKVMTKQVPYPVCTFVCPEGMWIGKTGDTKACRCP